MCKNFFIHRKREGIPNAYGLIHKSKKVKFIDYLLWKKKKIRKIYHSF
jgi:hypothetical protein